MLKRNRPFDNEDLTRQMKIHVGQKEVNMGVQADVLMQQVYERTLKYLKDGAKEENPNSDRSKCQNGWLQKQKQKNFKQMILNDKLELHENNGEDIKDPIIDMCDCGQVIDPKCCEICHYCRQPLCQNCSGKCFKCKESFCSQCSLTVYNKEEQQVCLNCIS